jgi:hypothetical protein
MSESGWQQPPPNGTPWTLHQNVDDLFDRERRELEELGLDFNYDDYDNDDDDGDDEDFNSPLPARSNSSMGAAASSLSRTQPPLQASTSNSRSHYSIASESPDPFQQFFNPSPDPPSPPPTARDISRYPRPLNIVDLTGPPEPRISTMPSVTRSSTAKKRRASSTTQDERQVKSARVSEPAVPAIKRDSSTEIVDLVDIEGDEAYDDYKAKQQAEIIKQQQQEEADKPVKLAEFQCIICMDNPTDLTVTHCGMSSVLRYIHADE